MRPGANFARAGSGVSVSLWRTSPDPARLAGRRRQHGRGARQFATSAKCDASELLLLCLDAPRPVLLDAARADVVAAGAGGDGPGALAAGARRDLAVVFRSRIVAAPQRADDVRGASPQAAGATASRAGGGGADAMDGMVARKRLLRHPDAVLGRVRGDRAHRGHQHRDASLAGAVPLRALALRIAVRRERPAARTRRSSRRGAAARVARRAHRPALGPALRQARDGATPATDRPARGAAAARRAGRHR